MRSFRRRLQYYYYEAGEKHRRGCSTASQRKFAYTTNPFSGKGVYGMSREEYYSHFFRNRDEEKISTPISSSAAWTSSSQAKTGLARRLRDLQREKISRFEVPDFRNVAFMSVSQLSFTLRMCRVLERRNGVDVDEDATTTRIDRRLWGALEIRAMELAPRMTPRIASATLESLALVSNSQNFPAKPCEALVKTAIDPSKAKPKELLSVLQSCARLRWRDRRLLDCLHSLALCWSFMTTRETIAGANAVSALGLTGVRGSIALRESLLARLPHFIPGDCRKLKALTALDYFCGAGKEDNVVSFIEKCINFSDSIDTHTAKQLTILEYHLRYVFTDCSYEERLPELHRQFLGRIRELTSMYSQVGATSDEDHQPFYHFSDVSRVLDLMRTEKGGEIDTTDLLRRVKAGPHTLDFLQPSSGTVIELIGPFQFFAGTAETTPAALARHRLLNALGFRMQFICCRQWDALAGDDVAKIKLLGKYIRTY